MRFIVYDDAGAREDSSINDTSGKQPAAMVEPEPIELEPATQAEDDVASELDAAEPDELRRELFTDAFGEDVGAAAAACAASAASAPEAIAESLSK